MFREQRGALVQASKSTQVPLTQAQTQAQASVKVTLSPIAIPVIAPPNT